MWTRRQFIKALGVLGGAVIAPFQWFERAEASSLRGVAPPVVGELYAGFLLLPDGAPVPSEVRYPRLGMPRFCGVGTGGAVDGPVAHTRPAKSLAELAQEVALPLYALKEPPDYIRDAGGYVVAYSTGEVFSATLGYEVYDAVGNAWYPAILITTYRDSPRPFPLWASSPVEPDGPAIELQKVDFLPAPGVMIATRQGYVFDWIEAGHLHILTIESGATLEETLALVKLLHLAN